MNETSKATASWQALFCVITDKMPKRFRILRELHNYSQEYVAHQFPMSQTGYGNIERGRVMITLDKIEKIAQIYKITIDELFEFDLSHIVKKKDLKI